MQSIWIGFIGYLAFIAISTGFPVEVAQQSEDPVTRIIIPPELPPLHFELLKEKSDTQVNCSTVKDNIESTPLNFLRETEAAVPNISASSQQPIVAFEGNKQIPIYITIPIYINTGLPTQEIQEKEPVGAAAALSNETPSFEKKAVASNDRNKMFTELFREAYRQRNAKKNIRSKKRVRRVKPYRIYRD